jgi:POT family proton-dependent oligopeptide transporter
MSIPTTPPTSRYPKGLYFLFATEMWERFSFYGISAVLVLYLTIGLGLPDKEAALASGAYIAFTFMTPILGGLIADRVMGLRYSVTLGGLLILIGNLILALREDLSFVFAGLALVALGTGYLKSTVSVMVGKLYADGDPHRDSGYTLFYMGINTGALLAGVLMAWAARLWGWHNCFYLSSAGMVLGLIAFQLGYPHYNNEADGFARDKLLARRGGVPTVAWLALGTLALGGVMFYLFRNPGQTKVAITWLSLGIGGGIVALAFRCKERSERNSILAILIIILAAICFQSFLQQMYNSLPLFVNRDTDKTLLGVHLEASFFALVPNSLAVILLASVFAWLWARLADVGRNPPLPVKIVIALCFAVASSGMLSWVAHGVATSGARASAWWIMLGIVVLTLGELNIQPMGLSAVSALAPKRFASFLMGSWFLCNSLGGYFSGFFTSLAAVEKEKVGDVPYTAAVYGGLYGKMAMGLAVVAVVMLVVAPFLKRLMAAARPASAH